MDLTKAWWPNDGPMIAPLRRLQQSDPYWNDAHGFPGHWLRAAPGWTWHSQNQVMFEDVSWFWWMFWWLLVICWWFWWFVDDFGDLLMILVICWWLFVLFFNDVWCFFMILGDCLMILDHLCHPSHWWLGVPQLGVAWKGIYNWISKDPKGSQDSIHLCILYCGISFQNFDDPLIAWKRQGLVRTSFREKIVFYSIPSDDIHPHRYPHEIGFPWLSPAQPGFGQGSAACVAATPSVPELFVVTLQGCCGSHGSRHCHWPSQNDCCHLHYPLVN